MGTRIRVSSAAHCVLCLIHKPIPRSSRCVPLRHSRRPHSSPATSLRVLQPLAFRKILWFETSTTTLLLVHGQNLMIEHPCMVKILQILLVQNIFQMAYRCFPSLLASRALNRLDIMWVYDVGQSCCHFTAVASIPWWLCWMYISWSRSRIEGNSILWMKKVSIIISLFRFCTVWGLPKQLTSTWLFTSAFLSIFFLRFFNFLFLGLNYQLFKSRWIFNIQRVILAL